MKTKWSHLVLLSTVLLAARVVGDDDLQQPELKQIAMLNLALEVRWQCPMTKDIEVFEIEKTSSAGELIALTLNPYRLPQTQITNMTTFVWQDTNVLFGVKYTYQVRSHSVSQASMLSAPLSCSFTPDPPQPLRVPVRKYKHVVQKPFSQQPGPTNTWLRTIAPRAERTPLLP